MRMVIGVSVLLLAILAVALPASADDIIMRDGTIREGKIESVEKNGVRVTMTPKSGGRATMLVPTSRLDIHWFYSLWDQKLGDDAKGRIKLALWAVEHGLFSRAKIQVQRAAKIDPQLVKDIKEGHLPEIREGIATRVLESAEKDMKKDDLEMAEKKLEILLTRMPDTEAGTAAVQVYKDLQAKMEAWRAEQKQKEKDALAEEERKQAEEREKILKDVDDDIDKARGNAQKGLTEDSEQKSLQLLKRAIDQGESALKKLERIHKNHGDDAELMKGVQERHDYLINGIVKLRIQRSDIYVWRQSTTNARRELDEARKLDPDNPDIASAEQRIDSQDDQNALDLRWQRNRREGMRFRGGGAVHGGRGGGARGGGGRRR